ncbi:MAG: ribosome biogenesis GTPase Der [Nitrospirae bacterium]|nr:MAG: ribosome biogenesis GTPase Der [Nitrospirota bacterium]
MNTQIPVHRHADFESTVDSLQSAAPLVAIIGRPNVGKSTLFNKILGHKTAIVDDVPGVTRDRNIGETEYRGRVLRVMDTGGLDPSATEGLLARVKQQTEFAILEADILVIVFDGRSGLTPLDEEIVKLVRERAKPVYVAANKIDTAQAEPLLADFYRLGYSTVFPISAEHGLGIDELLEAMLSHFPLSEDVVEPTVTARIAVVGRPNVGKSTLVNTILGQERLLVSDEPGTTRDAVDTTVTLHHKTYILTDTAGIRRRGRINRGVEGYSVVRAMRALGRSDVAVLVLNGQEGVTEQDTKIAGLIQKQGRACVLLVNKWDLRAQDERAKDQFVHELSRRLPFFHFVPVLFGSAKDPRIIPRLFARITKVVEEFSKRIPTSHVNQFLQKALDENPLPLRAGHHVRSIFMTQVATKPPVFVLFVRRPEDVSPAYLRYLENSLRNRFGFVGTPLQILVRRK